MRLGHANIAITLDTYSHVLPRLQEAAAEKFDSIFEVENKENYDPLVSKMLAKSGELGSRPYRYRTCDTLIKSKVNIFPVFRVLSKLEPAKNIFSF